MTHPSPPPAAPPPARGATSSRIALVLQVVLILALVGLVWWAVQHALDVLRARGVRSGFDFLGDAAGIPISEGWPSYSPEQPFWRAFLTGVGNTVRAAVPAAIVAVVLGVLLGVGRLVPHRLVSGLCGGYIHLVRNVPLLLQLLMVAFAIGALLPDPTEPLHLLPGVWLSKAGLSMPWPAQGEAGWFVEWPEPGTFGVTGGAALSPEYVAIVTALALYSAAFVAEIVRAGIQAVPEGQWLAARALGLQPGQEMRLVVLPQAQRVIVPALTNQLLSLTKNSSLAVAVGYPELVSVANMTIGNTGRAFECIAIVMAVYLALSLAIAALMNTYNRRVALRGWS
ncbi:amino acid ABC transporter permease [Comamonas serinivorans]|uniref:Amino acid ABC transporter permease n=1 Tax=Comamonas serinivorans TaxID=1082851 RepID=A0A1Y0EKR7_9BURK|nr:ABC transporter permease subunit [Comamonas serinivorans]ARU04187.1 amino acid ABC transporter permease [Comamonas serinivorans]